jgi:hypothetical protein
MFLEKREMFLEMREMFLEKDEMFLENHVRVLSGSGEGYHTLHVQRYFQISELLINVA